MMPITCTAAGKAVVRMQSALTALTHGLGVQRHGPGGTRTLAPHMLVLDC